MQLGYSRYIGVLEAIVTEINKKMRAPEAATYLQMAASTLAKLRCSGGGPRYAKLGPRLVVYDTKDLDFLGREPLVPLDLRICRPRKAS